MNLAMKSKKNPGKVGGTQTTFTKSTIDIIWHILTLYLYFIQGTCEIDHRVNLAQADGRWISGTELRAQKKSRRNLEHLRRKKTPCRLLTVHQSEIKRISISDDKWQNQDSWRINDWRWYSNHTCNHICTSASPTGIWAKVGETNGPGMSPFLLQWHMMHLQELLFQFDGCNFVLRSCLKKTAKRQVSLECYVYVWEKIREH